jgi:hypothetical protein
VAHDPDVLVVLTRPEKAGLFKAFNTAVFNACVLNPAPPEKPFLTPVPAK